MKNVYFYYLICFILANFIVFTNCLHFDFSQNSHRCFLEEFYNGSHVGINYKLWTKDNKNKEYENELLHVERLKSSNNKFSYVNKKDGVYLICAEYFSGWHEDSEILMKMTFISENMEEPNIKHAIKEQDLDQVAKDINDVIVKGKRFVKAQEEELDMEDVNARKQMHTFSYYYKLTVCQIICFVFLGVYQIFSFRKILKN